MNHNPMNHLTRIELLKMLPSVNLDLETLQEKAGGVWCFGSRANNCASQESDWDLLVISPDRPIMPRIRQHDMDVIYICLTDLDAWAQTELATHVGSYGERIDDGSPINWLPKPRIAGKQKLVVIAERLRTTSNFWHLLRKRQRIREARRLRLDLHRGWLMSHGAAVPPTAHLEDDWQSSGTTRSALIRWSRISTALYGDLATALWATEWC